MQFKLKSGAHYRREKGKMVRYEPGAVLEVDTPEEIGLGFMDKFERLDNEPEVVPQENKPLKLVHRGRGKYDVINTETEKAVNDELLTKKEAEALVGIGDEMAEMDNASD